jgi:hypothetical protein
VPKFGGAQLSIVRAEIEGRLSPTTRGHRSQCAEHKKAPAEPVAAPISIHPFPLALA